MSEILSSSQKESELKSKGDRLEELFKIEGDRFITDELKGYAEIPDRVKFLFHRHGDDIQILIIDGSKGSLDEIEGKFKLLQEEDLCDFPEARITRGIYYQPLIYLDMRELAPDILYVDMIEAAPELRGKGIMPVLYKQLEDVARRAGYMFLAGSHSRKKIVRVYLQMGRYLLEEIKPESQKEFEKITEEGESYTYDTIKFLNPADIKRYVKPDCLHKSIDERIKYNQEMRS